MKCRVCNSEMDREDVSTKRLVHFKESGRWREKEIETPSAIYGCPDCGSSYLWIKGVGLQVISESIAEELDFEFPPTRNSWRRLSEASGLMVAGYNE